MKPLRILVVGQTPPPFHGQAIMIQYFLDGKYQDIELTHVRMNFSQRIDNVGKFKLSKLRELFRVVVAIYIAKLRMRAEVLYYAPAGPRFVPVMRDIVILGMTRWAFGKTIYHFHAGGISEYFLKMNPVLRCLFRFALMRPDMVIRIAHRSAQDGLGLCAKKEAVVAYGIPDFAGESIQRDADRGAPVRILLVAVLREDKGVLIAIEAAQQLLSAGLEVELTCVGEWSSQEFQKRAESVIEARFKSRFKFPGVQTGAKKWEYYRTADIFLFPSFYHSETFGVVLLEAMCFSLPVVATKWRGIPEVVEEGSCAILCEPMDVTGCRNALAQLVKDSSLRQNMGEKSRERYLRHFTIETHRKAMECALSQLRETLPEWTATSQNRELD
jgi:glycosyltransferase involved in cell wall biosynthesis